MGVVTTCVRGETSFDFEAYYDRETTSGLTKLADDAQQHVALLSSLGVNVGPEVVVNVLDSKLPKVTADRWETTLERDTFPTLDSMYEFLYKSAVCVSKRERSKAAEVEKNSNEPANKKRRQTSNRAFVMNASNNCIACKKKRHPLYLCESFKQLPVQKRINLIREAKLCYNCLHSHSGKPCKFSHCTKCQKRHNTLLHSEQYAGVSRSTAETPNTNNTDTKSDYTNEVINTNNA